MMKNVANKSHHFLLEKTPSRDTNEKKCAVVKKFKMVNTNISSKSDYFTPCSKKKTSKAFYCISRFSCLIRTKAATNILNIDFYSSQVNRQKSRQKQKKNSGREEYEDLKRKATRTYQIPKKNHTNYERKKK